MRLTTPKGTSAWQRRTASLPAVTISRLFSLPFLSLFSNTSVGFSSVCPFLDFFKLSFLVDCLLLCSCHFFPLLLALLCFLWHLMLKSKFSELKNWITLTTERNRSPSEDFKYSQNNFCFSLNIHNICYDFFFLHQYLAFQFHLSAFLSVSKHKHELGGKWEKDDEHIKFLYCFGSFNTADWPWDELYKSPSY